MASDANKKKPQVGINIRSWLKTNLDQGEIDGLEWVDRGMGTWRLPWRYHAHTKWGDQDSFLLLKWAQHKKYEYDDRKEPTPDQLKTWKSRFRNALKFKQTGVKEIKQFTKAPKPYIIYQFVNCEAETSSRQSSNSSPDDPRSVSRSGSEADSPLDRMESADRTLTGIDETSSCESQMDCRSRSPIHDFKSTQVSYPEADCFLPNMLIPSPANIPFIINNQQPACYEQAAVQNAGNNIGPTSCAANFASDQGNESHTSSQHSNPALATVAVSTDSALTNFSASDTNDFTTQANNTNPCPQSHSLAISSFQPTASSLAANGPDTMPMLNVELMPSFLYDLGLSSQNTSMSSQTSLLLNPNPFPNDILEIINQGIWSNNPCLMVIKMNYFSVNVLTKAIIGDKFRFCYLPDKWSEEKIRLCPSLEIYGPHLDALLVGLPKLESDRGFSETQVRYINKILMYVERGVYVYYKEGDIYATRYCQSRVSYEIPGETPPQSLEKLKEVKVFDFNTRFQSQGVNRNLGSFVRLSFAVKSPELNFHVLEVDIYHVGACQMINQSMKNYSLEPDGSFSDSFDKILKIEDKLRNVNS